MPDQTIHNRLHSDDLKSWKTFQGTCPRPASSPEPSPVGQKKHLGACPRSPEHTVICCWNPAATHYSTSGCPWCCILTSNDNSRPLAAFHTTQFLTNNNVQTLPWPPMSPDLNPFEHISNRLDRRGLCRVNTPANMYELFKAPQQEWVAILAHVIRNLTQSMQRRFQAVIGSQEGQFPCWLACPSVAKYCLMELFSWTRNFLTRISCKMKFHELVVFCCWIFEHQLNSETNQTCVSLFEYSRLDCGIEN